MDPDFSSLPDIVTAPRTDSIYNCHAYLTKVPVAAIHPFIEAFTEPDEVVVDLFAGSGMTGIAAAMAGRRARLSDISVLGQHIATGYLTEVTSAALRKAGERVVSEARAALGDLYRTRRDADGEPCEMVRTVWSFTYGCPSCEGDLIYFHHLQRNGTAGPDKCPHCAAAFAKRTWSERTDVPVEVVVRSAAGRLVEQAVKDIDRTTIAAAIADPRQAEIPSLPIDETREMFNRSGLGKRGLTETGRFFSPRNAIALLELWRAIHRVTDDKIRKKLSFAFTAILPRASRRYQWSAKHPLNAQNQTYYIAPVYYEWNAFELFDRKIEAAIRAGEEIFSPSTLFHNVMSHDATYTLTSAEALSHLGDASVDYVFTDPPFGSNIFYSDMNLFHEAWLGGTTDHAREAVMHTTGKKRGRTAERYEALMRGAFAEAFRVLKPERHMSIVFGNSDGRIWGMVQRAIREAGFHAAPVHVAILDKGQRSVKGLNSGTEGVVTVDLVMTLQKPASGRTAHVASEAAQADPLVLIKDAIASLPTESARSPSHIYAAILRDAIRRKQAVDQLHLGDVLIALRNAGYTLDQRTGLLSHKLEFVAA